MRRDNDLDAKNVIRKFSVYVDNPYPVIYRVLYRDDIIFQGMTGILIKRMFISILNYDYEMRSMKMINYIFFSFFVSYCIKLVGR